MTGHGPLLRLARYDSDGFRPVEPGSVREDVVHVFAHGWQPGYRVRERLLATQDGVDSLPAWDPRLVDVRGRPLIEDYRKLLDALAGLGPDHAVLWYSWLDESATDADIFQASRSRQATQINGRRLAIALTEAMSPTQTSDDAAGAPRRGSRSAAVRQRLHLIGHSHGSAVVTHAAVSLPRRPQHLTLLDAPEDSFSRWNGASDLIDVVLPRLRPGRGQHTTFVDSYASAFGRPYHRRRGLQDVVDVRLNAPIPLPRDPMRMINDVHLYPVNWYARSVLEAHRGVGYGWSPLRGADTTALHAWYHSAFAVRPLLLSRHVADPVTRFGEEVIERLMDRPDDELQDGPFKALPRLLLTRQPASTLRTLSGPPLVADDRSAGVRLITSERDDELIEFDLHLFGCSGEELIEIELDGVPSFVCRADRPVRSAGRYVMLADGRPGEHLMTVRLHGAKEGAWVEVGGLRLIGGRRPASWFSMSRSAATVFGIGAVTGAVTTATGIAAGRRLLDSGH